MKYEIFLGGDDAEMREIKKVAEAAGHVVHDKRLPWGAKVSDYSDLLYTYGPKWAGDGNPQYDGGPDPRPTPVLVELHPDIDAPSGAVVIDHHGDLSGKPPAIIQVCSLLGVTPTREQCLIGAMDAGYAYGLETIGASDEEIRKFLGASPGCRTIGEMLVDGENFPPEIISEAERAIREAEKIGECLIIRCAHNKTSPITARLYDKQERQNVLILSTWTEDGKGETEANYYGNGETVRAISETLPGWTGGAGLMPHTDASEAYWTQFGGAAPDTAFWGASGLHHGTVLKHVLSHA